MTIDEARAIVATINDVRFASMGLDRPFPRPLAFPLAKLVEARDMVEAWPGEPAEGGGRNIPVIPADRLIAAVFVLWNYAPDREAIVWAPDGKQAKVVAVIRQDMPADDAEDAE